MDPFNAETGEIQLKFVQTCCKVKKTNLADSQKIADLRPNNVRIMSTFDQIGENRV